MGAVRTAKLAEHWRAAGADVRVIAVDKAAGLGTEPAPPGVHYLSAPEPGSRVTALVQRLRRVSGRAAVPGASPAARATYAVPAGRPRGSSSSSPGRARSRTGLLTPCDGGGPTSTGGRPTSGSAPT